MRKTGVRKAEAGGGDDRKAERERPARPVTREWLMRAAAHYLERYATSRANLVRVLERKVLRRAGGAAAAGDHAALIEEVAGRFADLGFIDDESYAEARLSSLRRRGTSRRMVAAKLGEKGVERDLVEAVLTRDETSEREAARAYARRRRLGPYRTRQREERRDKDLAAMMRAGFSFADASAVIDGRKEEGEGGGAPGEDEAEGRIG